MPTKKRKRVKSVNPRGRPAIRYDPERHPAYARALAIRGLTNEQIAEKLGMSAVTLWKWAKKYPDFLSALKEGKDPADANVELALYKRALGYEVEEERAVVVGTGEFAKVEKVKEIRHIPPDTRACFNWLKNRMPESWRDKQEIEHSGHIQIVIDQDDADL
jgi:transposase-like protein